MLIMFHISITEVNDEPFDHMLGDATCFEEITGLPDGEPDDHLYQNAHKHTKIHFSVAPIKVTYRIGDSFANMNIHTL